MKGTLNWPPFVRLILTIGGQFFMANHRFEGAIVPCKFSRLSDFGGKVTEETETYYLNAD